MESLLRKASLQGSPVRPLCEGAKVKPGLCWRPQNMGGARTATVGDLSRGIEPIPKKKSYVAVRKARSHLTLDIELVHDWEFSLLGFHLALVHYSLTVVLFLPF